MGIGHRRGITRITGCADYGALTFCHRNAAAHLESSDQWLCQPADEH